MKALLIFGFVAIFSFLACSQREAKKYECTEYSLDCELKKDLMLVLPLNFDPTITDVYGDTLNKDKKKNQWYLISRKVGVLVPALVEVCVGGNAETGPQYSYYPSIEQLLNYWGEEKIKINTTNLSNFIPGLREALIVMTGSNEVVHEDCFTFFAEEVIE